MTTYYFFSLLLVTSLASTAQTNQTYQQKDGAEQLIGMTTIGHLETDPLYASWFTQNYQSFKITSKNTSWTDQLVDLQVTIYYGSWCGDSKYYVPRFIKLWDELGLSRSQLKLIALYDGEVPNRYKQGPLQEEKDKYIHRVPTFIFAKNEEELARIVEHPVNDLETDVAQIALGYP